MRPLARRPHANAHQLRQGIRIGRQVLGLLRIELELRRAPWPIRRQAIQRRHRVHQIARQRRIELPHIRIAQVFANLVVDLAQRVRARLAIRPAGQRGAQNHLALRALAPVHHQLKGLRVAGRRVVEFHQHPLGDDARRVVANGRQRAQQGELFHLAGARRVLAHP